MNVVVWDAYIPACGLCFATSYQAFDRTDLRRIDAVVLFARQVTSYLLEDVVRFLVVDTRDLLEAYGEVHESRNELVSHCNVSRCLVGNMHFMTLLMQSLKSSTHADNVIIGVRTEDHHF